MRYRYGHMITSTNEWPRTICRCSLCVACVNYGPCLYGQGAFSQQHWPVKETLYYFVYGEFIFPLTINKQQFKENCLSDNKYKESSGTDVNIFG